MGGRQSNSQHHNQSNKDIYRIKYSTGIYEGRVNDLNKPHGEGKYIWNNSDDIYEGSWQDGVRHGKGIQKYSNGDTYQGDWFNNKKHGQGIYIWNNGDIYQGNWRDGRKNDEKGVFISKNPSFEFRGIFLEGKVSSGEIILNSKDKYSIKLNKPIEYEQAKQIFNLLISNDEDKDKKLLDLGVKEYKTTRNTIYIKPSSFNNDKIINELEDIYNQKQQYEKQKKN